MDESDILQIMTGLFRQIFRSDDLVLHASDTAAEVEGWDSFRHVEIILALQDRFAVEFSPREVDAVRCVGDLVALVRSKAAP